MSTQLESQFARELRSLRLLIEHTTEGLLAFSLYSDPAIRESAATWLENQNTMAVEVVRLSPASLDLAAI